MTTNDKKDCKEYILPVSSNDYVAKMLNYPMSLCRLVAKKKGIANVVNMTYLPVGTDEKLIEERYEGGGIAGSRGYWEWLVEKIQKFLSLDTNNVVILEDAASEPDDEWLTKNKVQINMFGNEVYHCLSAGQANSTEDIGNAINHAETAWRLLGVMSSLPEAYLPLPQNLNNEIMEMLVQRAEHLIVSAFDGEGYIISSF